MEVSSSARPQVPIALVAAGKVPLTAPWHAGEGSRH